MNKNNYTIDKEQQSYISNEGYLISLWFCNPLIVKKDINKLWGARNE